MLPQLEFLIAGEMVAFAADHALIRYGPPYNGVFLVREELHHAFPNYVSVWGTDRYGVLAVYVLKLDTVVPARNWYLEREDFILFP